MKPEIVEKLHRLNQEFYQTFSNSFSVTRERIQPGARKILNELETDGRWLDIGCGNGNFAVEWIKSGKKGEYLGVDFSENLLDIARRKFKAVSTMNDQAVQFMSSDILKSGWEAHLPARHWDGVMMFAALHHIPGTMERENLLRNVRRVLPSGSSLYLSVWQIQNSPRLQKRIQAWSRIDLNENEVDQGDVLMDWRGEISETNQNGGLRYVHIFSEEELKNLAEVTGFKIDRFFYSDGKEGNLALYQKWS